MISDLICIFTLFNRMTGQYLDRFQLDWNDDLECKAFNYHHSWNDIRQVQPTDRPDILLINERTPLDGPVARRLQAMIQFSENVYLVTHRNDRQRHFKKNWLSQIAGSNLRHPVLREHTTQGPTVDFLHELGRAFESRKDKVYQSRLNRYLKHFQFPELLEAQLTLLNTCHTPADFRRLLEGEGPYNEQHSTLEALLQEADIRELLRQLADAEEDEFYAQKRELAKSLFQLKVS